jgi:cytochrome c-type biogenesis protein CcmH
MTGWFAAEEDRLSRDIRCRFEVSTLWAMMAAAALLLGSSRAQAQPIAEPDGYVQGEKTLEGRLLAPCCWAQTLDIHESDIARALRLEVRRRLRAGESQTAIETDLVARYGERIRALPKGSSLTPIGMLLSLLIATAGIGAGWVVVRWVRSGRRDASAVAKGGEPGSAVAPQAGPDAYDDRLDAEIDDLPE